MDRPDGVVEAPLGQTLNNDPAALAAGMAELADAPERRLAMSQASRELGAGLTAAAMGEAYVATYREAIAARQGATTPA